MDLSSCHRLAGRCACLGLCSSSLCAMMGGHKVIPERRNFSLVLLQCGLHRHVLGAESLLLDLAVCRSAASRQMLWRPAQRDTRMRRGWGGRMGWCWLCEQDGAPEKCSAFKARIYRHAAGDVYTNYHKWSCNPTQKAHHQAEGKGGGRGQEGKWRAFLSPAPLSLPPCSLYLPPQHLGCTPGAVRAKGMRPYLLRTSISRRLS